MVPLRPGDPVQHLDYESVNDMKEDTNEQYDLEDLDQDIRCHEMGCDVEDSRILE